MTELDIRPVTLLSFKEGWQQPRTDEIRAILKYIDISGAQAANLVGVNSRTIRKWTGGEVAIPFSAWAILVEVAIGKKIWKLD